MKGSKPCDYCGEKMAVSSCGVCGAQICKEHDREHGCAECKGRMEF